MVVVEKRNTYKPEYKAKIVLEVLREVMTVNQIAAEHQISPQMVSKWKVEFLERAPMVFEKGTGNAEKLKREHEDEKAELEKKVGQLAIEVDWLKKIWAQISPMLNGSQ